LRFSLFFGRERVVEGDEAGEELNSVFDLKIATPSSKLALI